MNENALACSRCNYQAEEKSAGWRKCGKCGMLWCPKCTSASDRCANCVGGTLLIDVSRCSHMQTVFSSRNDPFGESPSGTLK